MKPDQQLLGSVLVTGGSGYLGELLYLRLKNLGVPVRNLDVIPPYITQYRTDWIEADITQSLPRGGLAIDTVFHAAAAVPLARDKEKFYRINAEGTKKVIEWSYEMGARNFIYISSSAVFGRNRKSPGAISGNDSPSPCEDYGRSKLLGEKYVAEFVEKYPDMKACIIRPRTIVGPGRLGIFEILFDWITRDSRVFILGNGENRLQFLHSEDLLDACILSAQKKIEGILHIGAENYLSLKEELNQLIDYAGSKSQIQPIPTILARPALAMAEFFRLVPFGKWHYFTFDVDFFFDRSASTVLDGWRPKYSNQEALRSAYDWYLKNRQNLSMGKGPLSIHKSRPNHGWLS